MLSEDGKLTHSEHKLTSSQLKTVQLFSSGKPGQRPDLITE